MTNKINRFLFWILLVAALIATGWWVLYVPYRPERLFSAIPANATVVSVHQNLAGEWESLRQNPTLLEVLRNAGVQDADLEGIATNDDVRSWITRLAADKTILAYVPALGAQAKPALVAATWVGGQSRRLRWQMAWIKSRDFQPVALNEGRLTMWLTSVKFGKTNLHLSLALSEGMVLGCLSEDPLGVRVLLEGAECYPNRMTLATTGRPEQARQLLTGTPRHWGWFLAGDNLAAYQLALPGKQLTIDLRGSLPFPPAIKLSEAPGMKKVTNLLGSTSDLVTILPLSWVDAFTQGESSSLWMNALHPLTDTNGAPENALAFAALLDQNHNSRLRGPFGSTLRALIKGIKTPTLLIGVQIGTGAEADSRINRILAQLNSQYDLNLVTRRIESGDGASLTLVEESRKNFYSSFEPDERIAYIMLDDWMILASNASGLKKVMTASCEGTPLWASATASEPSGLAWVNLDGLGKTVKNTAGVLKLATLLNSSPEMLHTRDILTETETGAAILRAFNQANASLSASGGVFHATIELGSP